LGTEIYTKVLDNQDKHIL